MVPNLAGTSSTESSREDPGEVAELAGVHYPLCRFELEDTTF